MKDYTIGIAGLASYATLDLATKIVNAFPAEKEWDRPHLIVDNNCMIPSRVRGILYGENEDKIIAAMTKQIQYLLDGGANRIIVDCNTAHYYVPTVCERVPGAKDVIINIIECCADYLKACNAHGMGLIASEGVLDTGIYTSAMDARNIRVQAPTKERYPDIRRMIESVKVNAITDEIIEEYVNFTNSFEEEYVVLGCTEIPVLQDIAVSKGYHISKTVVDPLALVINQLVEEFHNLPEMKDFK